MKRARNYLRSAIAAGLAVFLLTGTRGFAGTPKPKIIKGSGGAYFATVNFSFDGKEPAELLTGTGKDNVGSFTVQAVGEYSVTSSGLCTNTPTGNPGMQYELIQGTLQQFYAQSVIYGFDNGDGKVCVDQTTGLATFTGSFGVTQYNFLGKTLATGTFTYNNTVVYLANGPAGGGYGFFGNEFIVESGTLTKAQ